MPRTRPIRPKPGAPQVAPAKPASPKALHAQDSFQNVAARLGIGTNNLSTGSRYGFNPISRNHTELEWMYRGSWVCGTVVDCVADDMTRAGVEITGDIDPEAMDDFHTVMNSLAIWSEVNDTIKWGRLYGGAIAVMLIDGQDPATPLRIDAVGKNAFKGLMVLDRWMIQPSLNDLVTEFGPHLGKPKFYQVVTTDPGVPGQKLHYTRCLRIDGVGLPYWQRIAENGWGMSVIERLFDRLVAFDSTTQGAAQLVYKAHLRTMKVDGLRQIVAAGGKALEGLMRNIEMIRLMQSNEGMTVIDAKDEFEVNQYTFSGLDNVLLQFGQQLSGASGIPLVRLFGQSPAGLNSTGESDIRNYYDGISQQQERRLRLPFDPIIRVTAKAYGIPLPDNFGYKFNPLWQLSEKEKSEIGKQDAEAVTNVEGAGIIGRKTALKELKQSSRVSGKFSNITDEEIEAAEEDPPAPGELDGAEDDPGASGPQNEPAADPQERKLKLVKS